MNDSTLRQPTEVKSHQKMANVLVQQEYACSVTNAPQRSPPLSSSVNVGSTSIPTCGQHLLCCRARPSMGWSRSCIDFCIDSVQPLQAVLSRHEQDSSVTSVACSSPKREVASVWKIKYCPWETCSRGWNKFIHAPPDPCKTPWFYSVSVSEGTECSLCTTKLSLRTK